MSPNEITPEMVRDDAQSRVAKTGGQVGVASAVVVVAEWVAHQAGWHGELSTTVAANIVIILTVIASWVTNLKRLRA